MAAVVIEPTYVPAVGLSGCFDLNPPFKEVINTNEKYTVKSVRKLSELVSNNEDPYTNIYSKYNIEGSYELHLKLDISIVTLQSAVGQWISVPETYIIGYPVVNGIPYRAIHINIPVSPIPLEQDLTNLKTALTEIVKFHLGINVTPNVVQSSTVIMVSSEKHNEVTALRSELKSLTTEQGIIETLNETIYNQAQQIQALENHILSLTTP